MRSLKSQDLLLLETGYPKASKLRVRDLHVASPNKLFAKKPVYEVDFFITERKAILTCFVLSKTTIIFQAKSFYEKSLLAMIFELFLRIMKILIIYSANTIGLIILVF